MAQGKFYIDNK